jgi:hypothetical protein
LEAPEDGARRGELGRARPHLRRAQEFEQGGAGREAPLEKVENVGKKARRELRNLVVFVFRDPNFEPRWRWMAGEAPALKKRFGLDYPRFAQKLERSRKLRYLERTLGEAA